ncbi:hypothetical protein [Oleiagrimonas sp. MCCC 1A03011]|uniref:hypothetical protein n=1 Tax=Oleiagrimonas sp. MCCC 1A03011 TaxID=1926883 RepID=UPI000DC588A4|nr:hypothetical protein [Oleiagrimonas sp. MCCC 1A03011]RAP57748.1 hypothetical protein BTJ49_07605 [Oleiagrimonas sp. MCCC 1A03011]
MPSIFFPERFFGRGNDNGDYYVHQVTDREAGIDDMWWFGEHDTLQWAQVFKGRFIPGEAADDRWEGTFIDVPKGLTCNHGPLNLEMRPVFAGPPLVSILRQSRPFGLSGLRTMQVNAPVNRSVARVQPGFVGSGLENLTGVWIGDDHGTYYIREVSGTGEMAWVGENPEAEPHSDEEPGRRWVNVFMGQREGLRIQGEWADVPKGEVNQTGALDMQIVDERHIRITHKTGGFGGNAFTRQDDLQIELRWISLEIIDQQEWFFEADEPYFMALMVKMDGSVVDHADLPGASAHIDGFVSPMLGDNVGVHSIPNPIPTNDLPVYTTGIRPIPHADLDEMRTVFGIAVRGWEKDFSSNRWIQDRLADWRNVAQERLDRSLRADGAVQMSRDTGAWHETFSWKNEDDNFGLATVALSMRDILSLVGRTRNLSFDLRGSDVHYRVRASLTVHGARGNCRP